MNKTPREILFERHRSAEPRLDAVRRTALREALSRSALTAEATDATAEFSLADLLGRLWTELFWSCRRSWAGLAVAWLLIVTINYFTLEPPLLARTAATDATPAILSFLLEQKRLRAQPPDAPPLPEPATVPYVPRPRSERRFEKPAAA